MAGNVVPCLALLSAAKEIRVKHFSYGNESFQLDGVPEFPDDMKLFLGKVNNGTKAMRTGLTRSNPVTVSLDYHGFENGDVVRKTIVQQSDSAYILELSDQIHRLIGVQK